MSKLHCHSTACGDSAHLGGLHPRRILPGFTLYPLSPTPGNLTHSTSRHASHALALPHRRVRVCVRACWMALDSSRTRCWSWIDHALVEQNLLVADLRPRNRI